MPIEKSQHNANKGESAACEVSLDQQNNDTMFMHLKGNWKIGQHLPSAEDVLDRIKSGNQVRRITFDAQALTGWDSALLTFLLKLNDYCSENNIVFERSGLPQGVDKLISLATAVPERKGARKESAREPFFSQVGSSAMGLWQSIDEGLAFIGDAFLALLKFLVGKANFRRRDLILLIQECGANALSIVTLISVLVGLIFAFVGAVSLVMFGAQIYVANMVALSMIRVMGAVMVGIVMAGRTGAAFAAQLGTMQVNEEIDALKTLGVSPMEFLVLPRMIALVIMMPLLCVYADVMGIVGGLIVGVGMLDIGLIQYLNQTRAGLTLTHFFIGIFHAGVFGVLVALAGCLRGMQCGRSASAVGEATTSAVVTSIVAIIVATGIITVVCNLLGI